MLANDTIRPAITGVHGFLPDDVLSDAELAKLVDTSDAWIIERTGIKERRILKGEGLGTSHMASAAVKGLLAKTQTSPVDVDLLICATTTPDFVFPSTANLICDMTGIRNVGSFDVQAACSGFLYALTIATQFIAAGSARKIIVVGADKMSALVDYTDRATCVLFGDDAGAVMVERAAGSHASSTPSSAPTEPACRSSTRRPAAAACRRRRHRRAASAPHSPGRLHRLQGRGGQDGRGGGRPDRAQRPDGGRDRLAGAAPGQPAHHRGDRAARRDSS